MKRTVSAQKFSDEIGVNQTFQLLNKLTNDYNLSVLPLFEDGSRRHEWTHFVRLDNPDGSATYVSIQCVYENYGGPHPRRSYKEVTVYADEQALDFYISLIEHADFVEPNRIICNGKVDSAFRARLSDVGVVHFDTIILSSN